jgi:lipopolysaccharide/colanic/teichoic acid biosynthesis glycosyltransferase
MLKRLFDIVFSVIVLALFLPFGLIIALLIMLNDGGSPFYVQQRVGKHSRPFGLLKFRSMRKNADQLGKLTVGMRDPRITRVGHFIRKYKIDEFPQFINVLVGNMSVVGPRPEVKEYTDLYTEEQRNILSVKPGITDYASLEYFKENELLGKSDDPRKTYIEEIMPAKIELNKKYLSKPGIAQDLKIIGLTIKRILS